MNLNALKTLGGFKVQRAALIVQKYAPEILTGVGITGVVVSTVMIGRASTKLGPVMERHHDTLEMIHHDLNQVTPEGKAMYSAKEIQKELVKRYSKTSLDLIKLYGPGVSLSLASVGSILAAHGIMRRRTVALIGAYKAVESAFSSYRQRVIDEFGEEKDLDYRTGLFTETIEDEETGKKKKIKVFDPTKVSGYARFFDEYNQNWRPVPEYNLAFLKNQQNYANDLLRARGHIFLNEVYDMLGLPRSAAGQSVGWAITKDRGDNYVDFGMYFTDNASTRNFVNGGNEPVVLLDFNVDGVIIDLIQK